MVKNIKKLCNTCKESKYLKDFYKRSDTLDGYRSDCKLCYKNKSNNRWFTDPDFRARGNSRSKKYAVMKNYGLTVDEYDEILSKPCAICGSPSEVLDHDHITGINLEGLCKGCNTCIGNAKEDISILESAIRYLKKHNKKSKV